MKNQTVDQGKIILKPGTSAPVTPIHSHANFQVSEKHKKRVRASSAIVVTGRALYSFLFIFSAFGHFNSGTVQYAAKQGVPAPELLVPASGLLALFGGLSILLGVKARIGALMLIVFLIPVTLMMHNFWTITDPNLAQIQMVMFLKNISLLGAAILIYYFGSGPLSLKR